MHPSADGRFPKTSLGLLQRLRERPADGPQAWDDFCRRYRKPLVVFAVLEKRCGADEAEDYVQSFLAHLMDAPRLEKFDPALGRFRSWLLLLFKRFVKDARVAEKAQKRGGGWTRVEGVEERVEQYRSRGTDPAEAFAREWAIEAVRDAVGACDAALDGPAREWLRRRFRDPLDGGERPSRAEAAKALGLTDAQAIAADRRVKALLREAFERVVRSDLPDSGAGSAAQAEAGIRELLDALGG
jgi:hypothetical protein